MVEDLVFGRITRNTALISIAVSQFPATHSGFSSMKRGGLEGEEECDGTEVGMGYHFLLLGILILILFI